MSELTKAYWETFLSLIGLLGALASLGLLIVAIVKAEHGNYSEASFYLMLIVMWRVFDLGAKRRPAGR